KFGAAVWRLEKAASPPAVSPVALFRWLWARTSAAAGAEAHEEPGHGFIRPRRMTPPEIAPAQTPLALDQARSPTRIVLLVPSVMSAKLVRLLRKKTPRPARSVGSDSSPPIHAA